MEKIFTPLVDEHLRSFQGMQEVDTDDFSLQTKSKDGEREIFAGLEFSFEACLGSGYTGVIVSSK